MDEDGRVADVNITTRILLTGLSSPLGFFLRVYVLLFLLCCNMDGKAGMGLVHMWMDGVGQIGSPWNV